MQSLAEPQQFVRNPNNPFLTPVQRNPNDHPAVDAVAQYVYGLYDTARQHRKIVDAKWDEYYRFYRGQQTKTTNYVRQRDSWRAVIVVNHILVNIESICAVLLDNKPKINVSATSPQQEPYVRTMQVALDAIWRRRKCLTKMEDGIKSSGIYGTGYWKGYWNSKLEGGQGDVDLEHVPSEYIYPDPEARDFDESCRFVDEVKPVPMSYIRERWPDKWRRVKPDADHRGSYTKRKQGSRALVDGMNNTDSMAWVSPVGAYPYIAEQSGLAGMRPTYNTDSDERWVELHECWVRDLATELRTEQWMVYTPNGPVMYRREYEVMKYPNGRIIHVAGGVTLDDAPVEMPMWPYVRVVNISVPGEFFGIGEVELLKDLQIEHNRRRSQMMDFATLLGNGLWVIDSNAMVTRDMVNNRPGNVIFVTPGSRVDRMPPPNMPTWMPQMAGGAVVDMQTLSGVMGAASGTPPRGARSGAAFQEAQNIQTLRIRSRGRNIEAGIEQLGRIFVSLMQRYYTVPRVIRLMGGPGQAHWVTFDGRYMRGDWDVVVEAGSMTPTTKQADRQAYLNLYQLKLVDQRAVLEKWEIPDREEIMQRMGNPFGGYAPVAYQGWPGTPNPGVSGTTGYATSVRMAPPPAMPPPPGQQPPPGGGGGGGGQPQVQQSGGAPQNAQKPKGFGR